jgi:cysteinyl-tRNA synthetase
MIDLIERLIRNGMAYVVDGDVYFEVRRFPAYGRLSGKRLEELQAGARVEVDERKRDPLDFALWKASKPGEPAWPSPWGPGRPGWHIECSAMSMAYLGEGFDIHGGGEDLIFPHHENEIAQSEAATGQPFANFWAENGMVNLGGEKMSKSTGTLFFIEDIAKTEDPEVVRYYLLSTHFRSPIDFSKERLAEAGVAYRRLRTPLERVDAWSIGTTSEAGGWVGEAIAAADRQFHEAMDDDFNSAKAIGHLFDLSREMNRALDEGLTNESKAGAGALLRLGSVLGLFWKKPSHEAWDPGVLELVEQREGARRAKNWKEADSLRDRLLGLGVLVEDAPSGPKLKRR